MNRTFLAVVAAGLALVALAALGAWYFDRPNVLRVAVARDSDEHHLMSAVATVMAREHEPVRLRILPTDGAARAASAFDQKQVDLAVVRTDINMPKQAQTIAILQRSAMVILAPGGSKISHIADLRGRRIGIVTNHPGGMANARLLDLVLSYYDVSDGVEKQTLLVPDIASALTQKRVDVVVAVGSPISSGLIDVVNSVASAGEGQPIVIPVMEARALSQVNPIFEPLEIPRGAFGGTLPRPSNDVQAVGVSTRLVAQASIADAFIADAMRVMFAKRPLIAAISPAANRMEAPPTERGLPLPVHPGAIAYLDDEEETFLEKYSDFIYIGAMVLSILASAAAALASRFSAAGHARVEELMRVLIRHLSEARAARSLAELDELERDSDDLLAQALETSSLRHLDTHKVTALGLAMDQVRLAIRDRRSFLERNTLKEDEKPRFLAG
jgi:TRAP transporter TAXI family solute receptor